MLQVLTSLLGVFALTLSVSMFFYFIRSRDAIGRAVAYMLAGESLGIFITMLFSIMSNGIFDMMGPTESMVARVTLFTVASMTSVHLAYETSRIQSGGKDN